MKLVENKAQKPNFKVKHPYGYLVRSILLGLVLVLTSILGVVGVNVLTPKKEVEAAASGVWTDYASTSFASGGGTEESPYVIKTPEQLAYLIKYTDARNGALKKLASKERYTTFVIPNNIGGRYSVLTPVGLLPIATAGLDIDKLIEGAQIAQDKYADENLKYNECYKYAVVRNILYKKNKNTEILVTY